MVVVLCEFASAGDSVMWTGSKIQNSDWCGNANSAENCHKRERQLTIISTILNSQLLWVYGIDWYVVFRGRFHFVHAIDLHLMFLWNCSGYEPMCKFHQCAIAFHSVFTSSFFTVNGHWELLEFFSQKMYMLSKTCYDKHHLNQCDMNIKLSLLNMPQHAQPKKKGLTIESDKSTTHFV